MLVLISKLVITGVDAYFNENRIYDEEVLGCTCSSGYNFNPTATIDDGNCIIIGGCSDINAINYSEWFCFIMKLCLRGCTDVFACNFDPTVDEDDGSAGICSNLF